MTNQNKEIIKNLCETHNVEKLYLFGSATTTKFNEESDIDFLVKFKSFDLKLYFINYIDLKNKLKNLLYREIDLVEEQTLKNPYLISSIEENKELIYGYKNPKMAFMMSKYQSMRSTVILLMKEWIFLNIEKT